VHLFCTGDFLHNEYRLVDEKKNGGLVTQTPVDYF